MQNPIIQELAAEEDELANRQTEIAKHSSNVEINTDKEQHRTILQIRDEFFNFILNLLPSFFSPARVEMIVVPEAQREEVATHSLGGGAITDSASSGYSSAHGLFSDDGEVDKASKSEYSWSSQRTPSILAIKKTP